MLPLPTHTLNAVSQAEWPVLATLGSCPTIRALLLPKRLTHALHSMGNRQWCAPSYSVGQIYPCCSSGFGGNEFSPLPACKVISGCTGAADVSTPSHFSGIFFPLHQSKNHWQVLKRQLVLLPTQRTSIINKLVHWKWQEKWGGRNTLIYYLNDHCY